MPKGYSFRATLTTWKLWPLSRMVIVKTKFRKGDTVQVVGGTKTFEVASDTPEEANSVELMTKVLQNGTLVWVKTHAPIDAVMKI